jgi:DNA-3-methyladenine glycosylase II
MILHIVGQQISTTVALILYDRVAAATGVVPDADSVIALGPDRLRSLGLTHARARYVLDLAGRVRQGDSTFSTWTTSATRKRSQLSPRSRRRALVGRDVLIHQLRRRHVLPAGDISVRRAIARA